MSELTPRLRDTLNEALSALEACREELKGYEQDVSGETYNSLSLNCAIKSVEAALAQGTSLSIAENDVLAERARQITEEKFPAEWDDLYRNKELERAAACFALYGTIPSPLRAHFERVGLGMASSDEIAAYTIFRLWPFKWSWWKPENPRRALVKAGALILAAIERIDRAAREEK